MKTILGTSNRILEINLTQKKAHTFVVGEEESILAGKGLD